MVKVIIKTPIKLGLAEGRVLKPGEHLLSDEEMSLWFIPSLIASGQIVVVGGNNSGLEATSTPKKSTLNYGNSRVVFGLSEQQKVTGEVVSTAVSVEESTDSKINGEESAAPKKRKKRRVSS